MRFRALLLAAILVLGSAVPGAALEGSAGEPAPDGVAQTDRVLIHWSAAASLLRAERTAQLRQAIGRTGMRFVRRISTGAEVYRLSEYLGANAQLKLRALSRVPGVVEVEPDLWMTTDAAMPNDSTAGELWGLLVGASGKGPYGINALGAWDYSIGAGVNVAVVDTGYLNHSDLVGQWLPGYDMISVLSVANDGNGRDSNATDPGDWCNPYASSWHGTHVGGTVGALANNTIGVFGGAPGSKLLPVRVLGKCGGYMADVIDGIRWSTGASLSGIPVNANPARVLNLSLGGSGSCTTSMQNAVTEARNRGAVVVVAAGNSSSNASGYSPANCAGAFTVAATTDEGKRASFSNYGAISGGVVNIAGPGVGILSTLNPGLTGPNSGCWTEPTPASNCYASYSGTSMATPHVAAAAALVASYNPALTPSQIETILSSTATAFPADSQTNPCSEGTRCGAGIVNAAAALAATSPGAPGAPPKVAATSGNGQASVSWGAPEPGGSAITGYTVTSSPGGLTCTTGGALNCTVSGLTNGTSYRFAVTATSSIGTGPASALSNAVTPNGATTPGAPTNVTATGDNGQAGVSWSAPASNGGSAITGYTASASPGGQTCTTGGALNCTVSGLTNGTSYTFTVRATNSIGMGPASAPSNAVTPLAPATADTTAPTVTTPVVRLASDVQNAKAKVQLLVSWTASDPSGVQSVQLQQSKNGGVWNTVTLASATANSVMLLRAHGNTFAYRVRATDTKGNTSSWVLGAATLVSAVQESNAAVSYTGAWTNVSNTNAMGNAVRHASGSTARVSYSFNGSSVAWVSRRAPKAGLADVYIDGALAATVDLYAASAQWRRVVFTRSWPTVGNHTIEVRVRGTSGRPRVDLDAFAFLR